MIRQATSSLLAKYGFDVSVAYSRWPVSAANDNKMSVLGKIKRALFIATIVGMLVLLWRWM